MKLPEWLLSTPRLMALILVVTACYLAIQREVGSTEFLAIVTLALNFFFQQRKPETDLPPKQPDAK